MKAWTILGYAYNGADYCPACTRRAWSRERLRVVAVQDLDEHDLPDSLHTLEGEQVAPLFAGAEYEPEGVTCNDCGAEIVEPSVDECDL